MSNPYLDIARNPYAALARGPVVEEDDPLAELERRREQKRRELEEIRRRGDINRGDVPRETVGQRTEALANRALTAAAEGVVSLPEVARQFSTPGIVAGMLGKENPLPEPYPTIGEPGGFLDLKAQREDIRGQYEEAKGRLRESEGNPYIIAAVDTLAEIAAPGPPLGKAGQLATRAARKLAPAFVEPLGRAGSGAVREAAEAVTPADAMAHAGSDVSPEAISRVARGERYVRISPGGEVTPILNDVAAVDVRINPGEVKAVVGADGVPRVEMGRPNAAQARAMEALGAEPPPAAVREIPEPPEGIADELTPGAEDDLLASLGVRRGTGPERLRGAQRMEAAAKEPDPWTLTSSTGKRVRVKGTSNVEDAQDDLLQLARDNVDLVVATRDAPPLHQQLDMSLDDFLKTPAGVTFTPEQARLGGQLLGGLRREYKALANSFKDIADPAAREAARTELAKLQTESTNLFAVLQGRGYSQGGRLLNEAQRTKAALAQDQTMRLRMALIDRYADPAAQPAVAKVEAKAMQRLQRAAAKDAAFATRQTKRATTAAELDDEFGSLVKDFNRLSGSARPRMFAPDLAEVVGKMAKNRLRAGVNTLEEVADQIYQQVRQALPTATLEEVRATIVAQALKKPTPSKTGRAQPPRLKSLIPDRQAGLLKRYEERLNDDVIEQIAMLPDDPSDPALINFLRKMEQPTLKDYAGALPYHFMLSGPKTLLKNGIGNTVRRWTDIAMRPLEALVDIPMAKLAGRERERFVSETLPAVVGSYKGAGKGLERALFVLKNGYDPQRLAENLTGHGNSKWAYEGRMPLDPFVLSESKAVRRIGTVTGYGPRLLNAADAMAKSRASTSASYAWATRQAIKDVRAGVASDVSDRAAQLLQEQPDEMLEFAAQAAGKATFQDEMSRFGRWVSGGRRLEGAPGFIMRRLQPFIHVSDRIGNWLLDFTPAVRSRQIWNLAKEGDPAASDLIARQLVGTTVATAAAGWAFQGKMMGVMPRDEKRKNDAYEAGWQPYSAMIGGEIIPIRDLFGALAGPVVLGIAFHDNMVAGEPIDAEAIATAAGGAILGEARYLLDASYMEGLSNAVSAIEAEPDQMGRETAKLAARTLGGQGIPFSGFMRNVATYRDPRVVERQGPLDEIKSGIPGLRETLPSKIGPLGETLTMSTGKAGGFSPVVPTESRVADPQLAEQVTRLRKTVEGRRREINRTVAQIKDAVKAKDSARAAELRASLPKGYKAPDAALDAVRKLEQRVRLIRAGEFPKGRKLSPAEQKRLEIAAQQRMQQILERALR